MIDNDALDLEEMGRRELEAEDRAVAFMAASTKEERLAKTRAAVRMAVRDPKTVGLVALELDAIEDNGSETVEQVADQSLHTTIIKEARPMTTKDLIAEGIDWAKRSQTRYRDERKIQVEAATEVHNRALQLIKAGKVKNETEALGVIQGENRRLWSRFILGGRRL